MAQATAPGTRGPHAALGHSPPPGEGCVGASPRPPKAAGRLCSLSVPTPGPRGLVVGVGGEGLWVNGCKEPCPGKQKEVNLLLTADPRSAKPLTVLGSGLLLCPGEQWPLCCPPHTVGRGAGPGGAGQAGGEAGRARPRWLSVGTGRVWTLKWSFAGTVLTEAAAYAGVKGT